MVLHQIENITNNDYDVFDSASSAFMEWGFRFSIIEHALRKMSIMIDKCSLNPPKICDRHGSFWDEYLVIRDYMSFFSGQDYSSKKEKSMHETSVHHIALMDALKITFYPKKSLKQQDDREKEYDGIDFSWHIDACVINPISTWALYYLGHYYRVKWAVIRIQRRFIAWRMRPGGPVARSAAKHYRKTAIQRSRNAYTRITRSDLKQKKDVDILQEKNGDDDRYDIEIEFYYHRSVPTASTETIIHSEKSPLSTTLLVESVTKTNNMKKRRRRKRSRTISPFITAGTRNNHPHLSL